MLCERRVLRGLVLALVFATGSPALGGAFRCCAADGHGAMPGGVAESVAESVATEAPHEHHAHHASVGVQLAGPPEASAPSPVAPTERDTPCTCIGPCAGAAVAVASPPPAAVPRALERIVAVTSPGLLRSWVADDRSNFQLPFANGPPFA